jgi:vancomycin aglycone glucosyltransferase
MSERPILAADLDLAPCPADCPLPVQQIRCLHPIGTEPLPEKLEAFLDAGPPPVYIGFGSMTDPAAASTTRCVLDAVERARCRAVISRGWAGLGEGSLPEGVFIAGTVSHASLFPRCALVVHHGGAGTTTSAARAGVPQLVVPHLLDQFYWAGRVHALGLGPPALRRRKLSPEALAERIGAVTDNDLLYERAQALGSRLAALGPTAPDLDALL